jgi:malonyl-ACP decarboxylase
VSIDVVVTGMGVITPIAQGKADFTRALLNGDHAFGLMQRAGRQGPTSFLGAEIGAMDMPAGLSTQTLRAASLPAKLALVVLDEAFIDARLSDFEPHRIGLIVGGSNFQQRELTQLHDQYRDRMAFLRPSYGLSFMDSDVCGFCTEQFEIHGLAYTVGGSSASGLLAVIQAAMAVVSGQVDACIALGALMDLSYWECQALRAIGAMGSDRHATDPARACRPFDQNRDGFIFGECCAAVVVESRESSERRAVAPYGTLSGWGMAMDGNRNPDPSVDGEIRAIQAAMRMAGWDPTSVDYVNPHGTGSVIGDETELRALRACGLDGAYLNATKSLTGHSISAAGTVEVVATLLQIQAGQLHPTRNLEAPIDPSFRWVGREAVDHRIDRAVSLSMGFGGTNTAVCLQREAA